MTVKEFINQVFLNEYQKLLDAGFHYISFALIALGIEFLGACLDSYDFAKKGRSRARFMLAMQLFPKKYHQYSHALYEELRSGFAHQFRPGLKFGLTHRKESEREHTHHLGRFGNWTVLVAEKFYADFEGACCKVIEMLDKGRLTHPKFSKQFLKIT